MGRQTGDGKGRDTGVTGATRAAKASWNQERPPGGGDPKPNYGQEQVGHRQGASMALRGLRLRRGRATPCRAMDVRGPWGGVRILSWSQAGEGGSQHWILTLVNVVGLQFRDVPLSAQAEGGTGSRESTVLTPVGAGLPLGLALRGVREVESAGLGDCGGVEGAGSGKGPMTSRFL